MNYIENKINFEKKYMKFSLKEMELFSYRNHPYYDVALEGMKYYSKNDIMMLCLSFFSSLSLEIREKIDYIIASSRIHFLEGNAKGENLLDGNTVYENGKLVLSIVLRHNLYDLFILVHELTHCVTILNEKRKTFDEQFSLFSELLPLRIEDELISFLSGENVPLDDLRKCVKARKLILNNMVCYLASNKDNLVLNVDFEFRYLVSAICKERIKVPLVYALLNFGNIDIKNIVDFSDKGGIL